MTKSENKKDSRQVLKQLTNACLRDIILAKFQNSDKIIGQ